MPKAIRYCTSLNGKVTQSSLNGRKNLLSICLVHLFTHSTQAILGLLWMLDYEDVPGERDACEYLWGSERINHPTSSHKMTGSLTGFNSSQCVKEFVIPLIFPLAREVFFWGFYIHVFPIFSSSKERFFEVLFFYVLRFFFIFFLFYLYEVWVFWKSRIYVELMSIGGRISPAGGQVLHLAGLNTRIGGWRRSNHCNILYIPIMALSLC